jgi:pimeloyl-ACP methyl ester carboxylesterase
MPTIILVHGAWHGGWCWKRVVPLLRQAGYDVFAPSLTGLGDRVHLLRPEVDLTTHAMDVVNLLVYEGISDATLVGHSYGGIVLSEIAERAEARIDQLIYLDAYFPDTGTSILDYAPAESLNEMVATRGDGWRLPSFMSARDFDVSDIADAAWVDGALGDQPFATFQQRVALSSNATSRLRCAYIRTTNGTFISHGERAQQRGFAYRELLSAGHDSMVTEPKRLADLIVELHQASA